jgi:hypothetical protein
MPIRHENSVIPVKAKIRQIEKSPRITGDSSGVFCQPGQLAIAIRPINSWLFHWLDKERQRSLWSFAGMTDWL